MIEKEEDCVLLNVEAVLFSTVASLISEMGLLLRAIRLEAYCFSEFGASPKPSQSRIVTKRKFLIAVCLTQW